MRSISLIVVGMLAYTTTAYRIPPTNQLMCPMVMPQCNCRGDTKCYFVSNPCPDTECVPTAPSLQCANPVCKSKCGKGYDCIYVKSGSRGEGCGKPTCARPGNSNLM
ncbi:hypothetical protein BDF22DRAFT_683703 [Syncephalis plumigaleata]|nr:hypothetical protein BDF22DRAFT_683703 [Syncephalis plumigaleata]